MVVVVVPRYRNDPPQTIQSFPFISAIEELLDMRDTIIARPWIRMGRSIAGGRLRCFEGELSRCAVQHVRTDQHEEGTGSLPVSSTDEIRDIVSIMAKSHRPSEGRTGEQLWIPAA